DADRAARDVEWHEERVALELDLGARLAVLDDHPASALLAHALDRAADAHLAAGIRLRVLQDLVDLRDFLEDRLGAVALAVLLHHDRDGLTHPAALHVG